MSCPNKLNDICAKPGACLAPYCYEKPVEVERTQADEIAFLKNRIAVLEDVCKAKHEQAMQQMHEIAELRANLKRATSAMSNDTSDEWKNVIIEELVCSYIYQSIHEIDPKKALTDVINWNVEVALDPAVSADAKKLVDKTVEQCLRIVHETMYDPDSVDMDHHYYRGYNTALLNVVQGINLRFQEQPEESIDTEDFV